MKKNIVRNFTQNLSYAFFAQIITLIFSILMQLIVPKVLGVEEFAYWQLFIFYSSYVGLAHFGLMDGIYLRLGGRKYNEINCNMLGTELWIMFIWQLILAGSILLCLSFFGINGSDRFYVCAMTALYLVIANFSWYIGYIFQAINLTKIYSISVIIARLVCVIGGGLSLIFNIYEWKAFVAIYVFGQFVSCCYCIFSARSIVFCKIREVKKAIRDMFVNIKIGINLTLSNTASQLILGSGKAVMDSVWGIGMFGKFSFSLSLTNFILSFISQVSMVLFPALRLVKKETQIELYKQIRLASGVVFCGMLFLFIPIQKILIWWLPNYEESIKLLAILLPICVYDGKMQLLCNTYLKTLRKEREMLIINMVACFLSIILSLWGGYIIHSSMMIMISMVVVIAFRSFIAETYLYKYFKLEKNFVFWKEVALCVIFSTSLCMGSTLYALFFYGIIYMLFLLSEKNELSNIFKIITKYN